VEEFLKKLIGEVFGSFEWEELSPEEKRQRRLEEEKRERIKKLKASLTEVDYEILRLRKESVNLWGIVATEGIFIQNNVKIDFLALNIANNKRVMLKFMHLCLH